MKQEEKAQCSRARILAAATAEFGAKPYDAASLNAICSEHALSKGLIYHYYGNKDTLYLRCAEACFQKFTAFLAAEHYDFSDFSRGMHQYLERRFLFFRTNPAEGHLFFYTVLQPPQHLAEPLRALRAAFDAQGLAYYREGLRHVSLRAGVTEDGALRYFSLFQELFNGYFQRHMEDATDLDAVMQSHETQLLEMLKLMLYGIAKEQ